MMKQHTLAMADATTMLKFRHLLEERKLGEKLFAEVGRVLQGSGMTLKSIGSQVGRGIIRGVLGSMPGKRRR